MEKVAAQMKVNKEQVHKQIQQLKQQIDHLINEITVSFINSKLTKVEILYLIRKPQSFVKKTMIGFYPRSDDSRARIFCLWSSNLLVTTSLSYRKG
jgi:hypothetical protein